eukprot:s726_g10.t2
MTLKDEESDIQSTLSDAPPDWNSDDEPPDDHVGDENTCSRDGAVRKVIQKVGKGLERPGQNDIITLSFSTLQLDGSDSLPSLSNTTVEMGTNKLPMAVEFAVKHMRVGEVCEVRAPAVYSLQTSPLCGRSLRTQPGVLPKTDKVKRRYRFLPAAPRSVSEQAKKDLLNFRKAKQEATEKGDAFDANSPPMFRASVELLSITCVLALTEDRSVTKRILQKGSSRRQPRRGDVITFSYTIHGDDNARSETCTLTLGKDKLPFSGLHHVLLSMKEEECCLARLSSAAALPEGEDCSETHEPLPVSLEVTLLRWRRRDLLPVGEVHLDVRVNTWFGDFYDLLQKALSKEGDVSREEVYGFIFTFSRIAGIYIVVAVLLGFFTKHWTFRWRQAMNDYYMKHWQLLRRTEGASQRVQEDTRRFAIMVEGIGASMLQSVLTLVAFLPILLELSAQIHELPLIGEVSNAMVKATIVWALLGTVGLALIGIRLPGLEFQNQLVEAAFRKDLVDAMRNADSCRQLSPELVYGEDDQQRAEPDVVKDLFQAVRDSYFRLYFNFMYFDVAKYSYLQFGVVLPYIILVPCISKGGITLGSLQRLVGAFNNVERSFQFLVRNWGQMLASIAETSFFRLQEAETERGDWGLRLSALCGYDDVESGSTESKPDYVDTPAGGGSDACALLKTEIRQGPERRCHDIEAGSMVLAAMVIGEGEASLLSWRVGEGAVPGYMDVAVASMRFCESAAFEASEIVQACRPVGPSYEGQTPLRTLKVSALDPWLVDLLKEQEVAEDSPREGASAQVLPLLPIPADWTMQGEVKSWSDLAAHLKSDGCFKLVFLAATEAVDLCLLEEDGQMHFLELERAHGNALAKVGRFEEASEAYRRALDAVRHGSLYKALFPTERGHIQGAYSREAFEGDPLQKMSEEEVSTRRGQLVALHLNLSLCATKAGLYALARRHAETALGSMLRPSCALQHRANELTRALLYTWYT